MNSTIGTTLAENEWFARNTLIYILPYLNIPDILKCSKVCKLWNDIIKDPYYWRTMNVYECRLNYVKLTKFLKKVHTINLSIFSCKFVLPSDTSEPVERLREISYLEVLEIDDSSERLMNLFADDNPSLKIIRITFIPAANYTKLDLNFLLEHRNLEEIMFNFKNYRDVIMHQVAFQNLNNLKRLFLLGICNLRFHKLKVPLLGKNCSIESLGLGNCSKLDDNFLLFFKSFSALKELHLEGCREWNPKRLFNELSSIHSLKKLILIDFCIPANFDKSLSALGSNIEEFTIVPCCHKFKMPDFNTRILNEISRSNLRLLALKKFTWGFSKDYLDYFKKETGDVKNVVPLLENINNNTDLCSTTRFVRLEELESKLTDLMPQTKVDVKEFIWDIFSPGV